MKQTRLLRCNCDHDYQDRRYGKKRRVHNRTYEGNSMNPKGWRCTVCGKEKG